MTAHSRHRLLTVALALACVPAPSIASTRAGVQAPAPEAIAAAVQRHYDGVRDFSADFVQEAESGVLRKKLVEKGTVQVKKPGRMRWTYKVPEEKTFVSDGVHMYMYTPADRQVIVSAVPADDQATTAILFLSGKGRLDRDFRVSLIDTGDPATFTLRLDPKLPERDYDWLQITVDRASYRIRALTAADRQGTTSTFHFTNIKENVGLEDKAFVFAIPRGTDVIQAASPDR